MVRKELISSCGQEDRDFLASYNELEQLHMQVLLNCYLAVFVQPIKILKERPDDNLITLACIIVLVHYS